MLEPLSTSILVIMYFGDVVFAVSGALTAARFKMDILGCVLIGAITGIGGGTTRDLLLGRTVWWTQNPEELILVFVAAIAAYFWATSDFANKKAMVWADTLGLAAFGVVGCHIALDFGAPFIIAVFMGMVTATGGGVIRDVITNTQPMIMSGQLYASAALLGALLYATLLQLGLPEIPSEIIACLAAFALRAWAILWDVRMGPPGEFIRIGGRSKSK
ncbi:trimeric intracellular cation channel family protein [Ruegeria profundi]|uniref:Glycine transporter domain-containing protein n=1 Tax=Ruegeria profundi TaxID=1685378 RepID=A0A0X3TCD9_9RHOB|nr:TRIC cation channel family protein [Ruegeria profundi]KUJ73289.1 hypothetical protein AVO44_20165 [Ruegeria profundi]